MSGQIKVSDIATKVVGKEDDGELSFAIKALVENNTDEEEICVPLQGLDDDGFEMYEVILEGNISVGQSKVLTTKESYVDQKLFNQIVEWRAK